MSIESAPESSAADAAPAPTIPSRADGDDEPEDVGSLDDLRRLHATGVGYIFNDSGVPTTRRLHRADCSLVGRMALTRPKLYFADLERARRRLDDRFGAVGWTPDPACLRELIPAASHADQVAPITSVKDAPRRPRIAWSPRLPRLESRVSEGWLALAVIAIGGILLWRGGAGLLALGLGGLLVVVVVLAALAGRDELEIDPPLS